VVLVVLDGALLDVVLGVVVAAPSSFDASSVPAETDVGDGSDAGPDDGSPPLHAARAATSSARRSQPDPPLRATEWV
jgi:hypothetical protein